MQPWAEFLKSKPVDLFAELGAYEFLWSQPESTTKRIAELFRSNPGCLPSDLIGEEDALKAAKRVLEIFSEKGIQQFGFSVNGTMAYPLGLRSAKDPVEFLYHQGDLGLLDAKNRIAVVGTRKVSTEGASRTKKLVKELVKRNVVVVSGLAEGVDTVAHVTAINEGGATIAVIGTPLSDFYPKSNASLQAHIANHFLLVSQVPVLRYYSQDYRWNRAFFPERNKTMSALTDATVIVEAGETSGTLIQAKAALEQDRKLFILESNFNNPAISWPARYEALGAIRVKSFEDIEAHLK